MIRVGAGRFKGRRLALAGGVGTRPSSAKLKEAMFSALGPRLRGCSVADLFAGTGALGIEALSRGAASAVFVELDPRALRALRANLEGLELSAPEAVFHRGDAWRWLERYAQGQLLEAERAELLLMDPPYEEGVFGRLLPILIRLLHSGPVRVCALEHPAGAEIGWEIPPDLELRTRRHGRSAYSLLEKA